MTGKTTGPTVLELLKRAAITLQPKKITCAADKSLGRLEAEILLAHALKQERIWLITNPNVHIKAADAEHFRVLVARRKKHEPIAYILGIKEFYGLPFRVTQDTLIPRPETELLVELALNAVDASSATTIWDIGTGSGAVAIALAHERLSTNVLATDISPRALNMARKNAAHLKLKNITFAKANLADTSARHALESLQAIGSKRSASRTHHLIITANLPYLPTSDKKILDADVVKFEPSSALFVGKDGTELIEKLLRQLAALDVSFNVAFLEFDPPQSPKLRKLAQELFPHARIIIHKDFAKRNRVLEISRATSSL